LSEIIAHPEHTDIPDGGDVLLFTSQVYHERNLTTEEYKIQLETIESFRER
jgi:hypothetical protein